MDSKNKLRKKVRTISGVTIISVMTKPIPCPGRCVYCPGGSHKDEPTPKSYVTKSPTVLRAGRQGYESMKQIEARISALKAIGHIAEKNEVIVMGGTFISTPVEYRESFIKGIYNGLNGFIADSLEESKKINETAKQRCVALCIETRPDWCRNEHIDEMLRYGATRVEMGVQLIDDESYNLTKRGHSVKDVIDATKRLKDAGFKVYYHYMCNLPGSDIEKDIIFYDKIFSDPDFRPDGLKIYPCQVVEGTQLVEWFNQGMHTPYTDNELVRLVARLKQITPRYARIQSVMRALPAECIVAGTKCSGLRVDVQKFMRMNNMKCQCIRCREVGYRVLAGQKINSAAIKLNRMDYEASGGKEVLLTLDDMDSDSLIGILRLRIPSSPSRPEITENSVLVRELHVYGLQKGIKQKDEWTTSFQHKGFGKQLLEEAERIAKEMGFDKIVVISGVGAREYYRKFGYSLEGPYMVKNI